MVESTLMKNLLEAGVHFGHETKRWNPKMRKYIFGQKNGIYIIDLEKTEDAIEKACSFLRGIAEAGQYILFVGTKKQAQEIIKEEAMKCGMFYVNQRWLGGMLTNFQTLKKSLRRLEELERIKEDGTMAKLSKKEASKLNKEMYKLNKNLEGVRAMEKLPKAMFVVDAKKEDIAVKEANILKIPVVALVDTNSNPDVIQYVIPGNDDAIRSIKLITSTISDAISGGKKAFAASEAKARKEAEEEAEEESGETIKVIDEKVEELVAGDLKLKEDETLPKDVPIKKKAKTKMK
ncbi:MAG: 30S ribosomal protein S2 [Candidatus Omnitrophica bacterium]|nr:30S ribosomal protein S2 [Candidatus Omnitrophota bacterium]